ncbi:MAG: IclR family transcriptional regulator C-terminal domain-containing protein, partial [Pseudomonadota bacterium]
SKTKSWGLLKTPYILAHDRPKVTALKRRLKQIRATGVAVSVDGMFDGVYSIAMPVFDAAGQVPAGLSISAPSTRGERHEERFAALLTRAGEDVSRVLGFNGTYPPLQDQHSTALWKARTP